MSAEVEAARIESRNEHTVAMLAAPDAWASADLPGWVRDRFPGIDLREPATLPEPDRCAEGRPWGADPYGVTGLDLDDRWRRYVARQVARPCRNRWRDRATLLCGTHLATWQRSRTEAERSLGRERRWTEATELARELGRLGVLAEANPGGVLLRPTDAHALVERLSSWPVEDERQVIALLADPDGVKTEERAVAILGLLAFHGFRITRKPTPSATDTTGA